MFSDITLGQYIPGESIIHKVDPRTKIILIFFMMIIVFIANSLASFIMVATFITIIIFYTSIPIKYIFKGLKPVLFVIVLTAIINAFTVPGRVIVDFKIINITYEGLLLAGKMTARISLLIITASILTLTTTPIALTDGIEKLMKPLNRIKVPVHEIAMMMSIALRFIPTLIEETDKIMKAQASRGADFDTGNVFQKAKSYIPVLVPLFVSSFKRADELAMAMISRGYRGSVGRTKMKQLKYSINDLKVLLIFIMFTVFFFIVEIG